MITSSFYSSIILYISYTKMASNIPEGYNADGEISGSAEDNPTLSGINEWEDTTDQE